VITWTDNRNGDLDIYAQRYSSDGIALGNNFKVNDDAGDSGQIFPSLAIDSNDNFIVTWTDPRNFDENHDDIYAQRYSSDGTALGNNFKVNDDEGDADQGSPSVSSDENGNFLITWLENRNDKNEIYAQLYSSEGNTLGENFNVTGEISCLFRNIELCGRFSSDGNGNFTITWTNCGIFARRYSSDGTALGNSFKVNDDEVIENWSSSSISADSSGNFVISWDDEIDGNVKIYAQRYSSDGSAIGGNFKVTNTGFTPNVKLLNGRIYTTWSDPRGNEAGYNVWANVLDWNDPVGISDKNISQILSAYKLSQNHPNPFNPTTVISWQLAVGSDVEVSVYNLLGQKVAKLVSEKMPAGYHEVEFNGQNLSSGVYLYRIEAGEWQDVKKMILLR
jgi:hypothetical protein